MYARMSWGIEHAVEAGQSLGIKLTKAEAKKVMEYAEESIIADSSENGFRILKDCIYELGVGKKTIAKMEPKKGKKNE